VLAAIEGLIAELRQIGVPVSLAERIDAVQSLRHLPVADRGTVQAALRAVLVKSHDHELALAARRPAGPDALLILGSYLPWRTWLKGTSRSAAYSRGIPSTRSLMMLRAISVLPPPSDPAWRIRKARPASRVSA
jgi:hypothetical protein